MRKKLFCFCALSGSLLLLSVSAVSDMLVWSENAMVKVRPTDIPKGGALGVSISAARNEYESFQIIVRAQDHPLSKVELDITDFLPGDGKKISCKENCTLYRELYVNISSPTLPFGSSGEWPDALIPDVDRYFGERRNAFPFDVSTNRNQPVWIDVYVPVGTTPGIYTAYVNVHAKGEETLRIPVYLTVWSFTLPARSSFKTQFCMWQEGLPLAHGSGFTGKALDELARTYSKALLAHRLSDGALLGDDTWLPTPLLQPSPASLADLYQGWNPFFDGSVLSDGQAITAFNIGYIRCLTGTDCRADVVNFYASAGWLDKMYVYLLDEPDLNNPAVVQEVKSEADSVHQLDKRLRTLLTHSYSPLLEQQVDTWVVPLLELDAAINDGSYSTTYGPEISLGKEIWLYLSCPSHFCGAQAIPSSGLPEYPDYMIDEQGVKLRIQDWLNWKFRVTGELYWSVNYQYQTETDPYQAYYLNGGNGAGYFLYPGTPDRIGGRTNIPIESIRLKLKREGLEDYEYLALLTRMGGGTFADSEAAQLVKSAGQWEHNPEALYRVRTQLAAQIEILSRGREIDGPSQ